LSQRSGWSKVGPVSALVHTPAGYRVQANVPVVRTGHQDSLDLAALPDELVIRVTKWPLPRSLSGAWRWYGALLVAGGLAFSATIMARRRGVRR
jgi:hypothetical protein